MMRLRPCFTWIAFAFCLCVVCGAMVWMSATTLRLERAEFQLEQADQQNRHRSEQAEYQAEQQSESERLALWRMDSALVAIVTTESSRPHRSYRAFYQIDDAYSKSYTKVERGEIQVLSPLLTYESPYIVLHFQFDPSGKLTSPQIPADENRRVVEENYTTHANIEADKKLLKDLSGQITRKQLLAMLSIREADPVKTAPQVVLMRGSKSPSTRRQQLAGNLAQQKGFYRSQRNVTESNKRMQTVNNSVRGNNFGSGFRRIGLMERVEVRPMKAIWAGDRLLLVRETRVDGKQYLQGCVLNWPAIRKWMTKEIDDLLPQARLLPQKSVKMKNSELMLASIPVKLVPGKTPVELLTEAPAVLSLSGWTPMRYSLLIAWVCIAMAAIAVAALLLATIRLSERRGTFVSAVTHELRTPLTTFRMYTDMLCSGIVTEKEQQQRYLNTLQIEADRLGHLVENVLFYARLESPKKRPVREAVCLGDVIRRLQDSLERRVQQAEMQLEITLGDDSELNVQTDAAAVERILSNLVDNACKYAASAEDCRIHIECEAVQQTVRLRVRDHGPGLNAAEEKRMFLPFSKSDSDAANSAPGVGLGLSLCRRLAKNMGGELRLDKSIADGACFELTLPAK